MPEVEDMKTSRFVSKGDVRRGVVVTIVECKKGNTAPEGKAKDIKWLLYTKEFDKPLTMNMTRLRGTATATGLTNSDNWGGKQIYLDVDEKVEYPRGTRVGGIRCGKVQGQPNPDYNPDGQAGDESIPF